MISLKKVTPEREGAQSAWIFVGVSEREQNERTREQNERTQSERARAKRAHKAKIQKTARKACNTASLKSREYLFF